MRDSMLTIRLPAATRQKIERYAEREGRSLSQATERLIELGLGATRAGASRVGEPAADFEPRTLAGALRGGLVPTLDDFKEVRAEIGRSLDGRTRLRARARR